jgi:hypothetical protein
MAGLGSLLPGRRGPLSQPASPAPRISEGGFTRLDGLVDAPAATAAELAAPAAAEQADEAAEEGRAVRTLSSYFIATLFGGAKAASRPGTPSRFGPGGAAGSAAAADQPRRRALGRRALRNALPGAASGGDSSAATSRVATPRPSGGGALGVSDNDNPLRAVPAEIFGSAAPSSDGGEGTSGSEGGARRGRARRGGARSGATPLSRSFWSKRPTLLPRAELIDPGRQILRLPPMRVRHPASAAASPPATPRAPRAVPPPEAPAVQEVAPPPAAEVVHVRAAAPPPARALARGPSFKPAELPERAVLMLPDSRPASRGGVSDIWSAGMAALGFSKPKKAEAPPPASPAATPVTPLVAVAAAAAAPPQPHLLAAPKELPPVRRLFDGLHAVKWTSPSEATAAAQPPPVAAAAPLDAPLAWATPSAPGSGPAPPRKPGSAGSAGSRDAGAPAADQRRSGGLWAARSSRVSPSDVGSLRSQVRSPLAQSLRLHLPQASKPDA